MIASLTGRQSWSPKLLRARQAAERMHEHHLDSHDDRLDKLE
jgi:hypothetical protein